MLRRAAALAVLAFIPVAGARAAGPPTMALGDVHPGMDCLVASVIQGTDVTTFAAHIDQVLGSGADPASARILLTVSGPAVDATGVGQGFSGSPITCTGGDGIPRIAGAISETVGSYGGHQVLATPIEAILAESVDPPAAHTSTRLSARDAAVLRRARPIAEPLSISGLSAPVGAVLQRAAARAGRTLVLAPAHPLQALQAPPIVPGSAIGVTLAMGDVDAGAIGTAAYVDGTTVWGFGHPFDGAGRRSLFLTSAYVYAVIANPLATSEAATYKLAAPTGVIGTLTQDGASAVVGRLGAGPPSIPLQITTRDLDTGRLRTLSAAVADERAVGTPTGVSALATIAPAAIAQAIYAALDGSPVRQSGDLCLRITVRERPKPLGFCNTYVGGGGGPDALAGGPLVADAGAAMALIDGYDAGPLTITRAAAGVRLARGLRIATLTGLDGPAVARRGSTITVHAHLRRPGGAVTTRAIRVTVPRGMPTGQRDLFLKGTSADVSGSAQDTTIDLSSLFDPASGGGTPAATSLAKLASDIADIHRYDGVTARFLPPGDSVSSSLPGGREGVAQRARRAFRDATLRVDGRARLRLRVR